MSKPTEERQLPMFELIFAQSLNPNHELLRAARLIDWDGLQEALSSYYSLLGRAGKPIRLMVGIHILKHRYNASDERAVEELHENAYWQSFCGFQTFQTGEVLDPTSLVKFRNRIGAEGMKRIEEVLFKTWSEMGLVKTKRVSVDTTSQPKDIAYPTDVDLLHRIREKIVREIKRVREGVTLRKPFRTFGRTGKKLLFEIKRFCRKNPEKRQRKTEELKKMVKRVVRQASAVADTLYARGHKEKGRRINQLASLGKKIIEQTEKVLKGEKPASRIYSLHEPDVAVIRKGKIHIENEFGSLVSLAVNEEGLILSHEEYQENLHDLKTLSHVICGMQANTGKRPDVIGADRGFSQALKKQERLRKRLKVKRMAIARRGKKPHPDHKACWFQRALRQRVRIEPVIGHLKNDHRMNRCRYKGKSGDTANVVWAVLAWNTKKIAHLHKKREEKQLQNRVKMAA
jgi:transposase, IS5 family